MFRKRALLAVAPRLPHLQSTFIVNQILAHLIDRFVISLAGLTHAESADRPARSREAAEWLARPDFFTPDAPAAKLEFSGEHDFTFASPCDIGPPRNRLVHGRLFRAGSSLKDRPTVVLMHGWNDEPGYLWRQPALARRLAATGLNVAMLELPYHLHRRPGAPPELRDFISGDLAAMVAATHQALADHRALFGWLEEQGTNRIAIWGYSLGAWLAGLLACHDSRVDTAVLSTPLSDVATTMAQLPFCRPLRRSLAREPVDLSRLNLASHRPRMPLERVLLLVGEHDLFIPRPSLDELWEVWGRPERRVVAQGHLSILASRRVLRDTSDWLWSRLVRPTTELPLAPPGTSAA
jgi:pimeloyl-ACP methyl ester carboxylesterase